MTSMRQALRVCSLESLKMCAYSCGLPKKANNKAAIIDRLKGAKYGNILEGLDKKSLMAICDECGVPRTGNRDALSWRILENLDYTPKESVRAMQKCIMCEHKYHPLMMDRHHFVPKKSDEAGGWVPLCGNCHHLFTRISAQWERETGRELADLDDIEPLFAQTKKDVKAGKYSRK